MKRSLNSMRNKITSGSAPLESATVRELHTSTFGSYLVEALKINKQKLSEFVADPTNSTMTVVGVSKPKMLAKGNHRDQCSQENLQTTEPGVTQKLSPKEIKKLIENEQRDENTICVIHLKNIKNGSYVGCSFAGFLNPFEKSAIHADSLFAVAPNQDPTCDDYDPYGTTHRIAALQEIIVAVKKTEQGYQAIVIYAYDKQSVGTTLLMTPEEKLYIPGQGLVGKAIIDQCVIDQDGNLHIKIASAVEGTADVAIPYMASLKGAKKIQTKDFSSYQNGEVKAKGLFDFHKVHNLKTNESLLAVPKWLSKANTKILTPSPSASLIQEVTVCCDPAKQKFAQVQVDSKLATKPYPNTGLQTEVSVHPGVAAQSNGHTKTLHQVNTIQNVLTNHHELMGTPLLGSAHAFKPILLFSPQIRMRSLSRSDSENVELDNHWFIEEAESKLLNKLWENAKLAGNTSLSVLALLADGSPTADGVFHKLFAPKVISGVVSADGDIQKSRRQMGQLSLRKFSEGSQEQFISTFKIMLRDLFLIAALRAQRKPELYTTNGRCYSAAQLQAFSQDLIQGHCTLLDKQIARHLLNCHLNSLHSGSGHLARYNSERLLTLQFIFNEIFDEFAARMRCNPRQAGLFKRVEDSSLIEVAREVLCCSNPMFASIKSESQKIAEGDEASEQAPAVKG